MLSKILQKDAEQEMEMRTEIQNMRLELSSISMMDEFARYARLERKINKMTDKLKTHGNPPPDHILEVDTKFMAEYLCGSNDYIQVDNMTRFTPIVHFVSNLVKSRTAQQAKMKWIVNIIFYILQAVLMISLIWKYYADPVTVVPSKWISPLERLVAFPSGVAGGVGITCWLVVCNKVVAIGIHAFS